MERCAGSMDDFLTAFIWEQMFGIPVWGHSKIMSHAEEGCSVGSSVTRDVKLKFFFYNRCSFCDILLIIDV